MIIRAGFTSNLAHVAPKSSVVHYYSRGKCFMFRAFDSHEEALAAARKYVTEMLFSKRIEG